MFSTLSLCHSLIRNSFMQSVTSELTHQVHIVVFLAHAYAIALKNAHSVSLLFDVNSDVTHTS